MDQTLYTISVEEINNVLLEATKLCQKGEYV